MKILLCLLMLLFCLGTMPAHAGFVMARHSHAPAVAADSPEVRSGPIHRADPRMRKTPTKQVNSYCVLSLLGGLLSAAGVIALILLWPVSVWVGVALGVGILATGIAAIVYAILDSDNIKPHSTLNITGGTLGFLAILPVVTAVAICFGIYIFFHDIFTRRRRRRRNR